VRGAGVVQIRQRRAQLTDDAEHRGYVVDTRARDARTDRLTGDPAAEISGAAPAFLVRRPVVVRRRRRRVVAMRQSLRFGLEPRGVAWLRRAHQRQRTVQRVDDLLEVPVLVPHTFRPPAPAGRKLPVREVLGQRVRDAMRHARLAERVLDEDVVSGWGGGTRHYRNLAGGAGADTRGLTGESRTTPPPRPPRAWGGARRPEAR
jgi:hypothetical protein